MLHKTSKKYLFAFICILLILLALSNGCDHNSHTPWHDRYKNFDTSSSKGSAILTICWYIVKEAVSFIANAYYIYKIFL